MASEDLLKKAVAAFKALSPEQQAEMLEEQRQSWVRGNVGLSRDERGMTSPVMPRFGEVGPMLKEPYVYEPVSAPAATDTGLETAIKKAEKELLERIADTYGDSIANDIADYLRRIGDAARSQAVELLATERAEKELAQQAEEEAKDLFWSIYSVYLAKGGVPVSTDKARSALSNRIATLEADNAAQAARIEGLEKHCELLCDPTIIRLEKENSDLEAKLAAAGKIGQEVLSLIAGDAGIPDHIRDKARAVLGGKPS